MVLRRILEPNLVRCNVLNSLKSTDELNINCYFWQVTVVCSPKGQYILWLDFLTIAVLNLMPVE